MLEFARNPPGCFCQYCRRKYRESFGLELPGGPPVCSEDWLRFVQWRYKCIEELLQDIVAEVKKDRPDCVFTHNAFAFRGASEWASGEDYEQLFQYDDVVTNIPSWDFGGREKSRYVDMIWQAGLYTRAFRGLSENRCGCSSGGSHMTGTTNANLNRSWRWQPTQWSPTVEAHSLSTMSCLRGRWTEQGSRG